MRFWAKISEMGQSAGRLKGVFRPVKNFNVEERAFKEISKSKPRAAPDHESMKKIMKEIRKDPELLTKGKMDPTTMKHLSKVFIKSEGDNPIITSTRKLPKERKGHDEYEYGYEDPKVIPKGKASMKQVLEFLSNHQKEPSIHTVEKICKDYNLDLLDVSNALKYFKPFDVYIPPKADKGPKLNPARLLQQKIDQLKE